MRLIRYLKHAKGAVALIIVLLMVQAFADLSLPRYTSQIVDIGIQQSGIEHVAPKEMTASTYTLAYLMTSGEDRELLQQSYWIADASSHPEGIEELSERVYLDEEISEGTLEKLDTILAPAFALRYQLSQMSESEIQALEAEASSAQAQAAFDDIDPALLEQQAIMGTRAEYEAIGFDLDGLQMDYLIRVGLIMVGLAGLGMAVAVVVGFVASRTGAGIGQRLRGGLFKKVVSFSDAEIQQFSTASLITRGTNDIQQIQMVTVLLLRMMLYAPILAIGGIFMVSRTSPGMSWIILLAVGVIAVLVVLLMRIAMPKFKIVQQLIDRVNLVSRELLTGVSVIRVFDRQSHEEERFDEASTKLMRTQLFTNRVMTFMMPLMMVIMNAVSVLIVWVGASYIDMGAIQTGDLIAFITYAMVIIMSFLMIGMIAIMLPRADVAAGRVNEVLKVEPVIDDPASARDEEIDASKGATLVFDDVSFTYSDSEKAVLENISFTAEPGKTTAIIGSTGSGKSTIVKLIERFHDVTSGSITLDGIDIRELSQHELRSHIGYVPQKAFLFSGTIESNVTYSGTESEELIEQAIQVAQAKDFIESKEEGLEAEIAQGGANVSGGQRQRLAIARALAAQARIFLFDDSFSALDYKTDALLRQALTSQLKNKTMIIVAQRLSTIMDAEQIIVIDEGRVVGKGTHQELLKTCDAYHEIALSQLSPEELEGGENNG